MEARSTVPFNRLDAKLTENILGAAATSAALTDVAFSWRGSVPPRGSCRPNGLEVNPRGQGPRGYGSAAHGLPACESRDAGRAPPCRFWLSEPARPAGRSRAAPGSTSS